MTLLYRYCDVEPTYKPCSRLTRGFSDVWRCFSWSSSWECFQYGYASINLGFESKIGKVNLYEEHVDPATAKAAMVIMTGVKSRLKPLLTSLARGYSPVRSEYYLLYSLFISIIIFLENNPRIFFYEKDAWVVKGRYNQAVEDNNEVVWDFVEGQDVLTVLIVSAFLC